MCVCVCVDVRLGCSTKPQRWSDEEKAEVQKLFRRFIVMQQLPGKRVIENTVKTSSVLKRPWRKIKDHIRNEYCR